MIFNETNLAGSFVIKLEKKEDERGFMARAWDQNIFSEKGLNSKIVQCNVSFSKKRGTLRGMHYQLSPYRESKLIRCTRGSIFDVIIDLRYNSKTYKNWFGIELHANDCTMIYVPEGFAHGFQTLEDNTEVFYQMSEFHNPQYERGIKWNDSAFNISWPLQPTEISAKDSSWKPFEEN